MLFLQCPESYALFYSLDIRNFLCRGVKLVQIRRRLQCAYKILRNRSSHSTRGHDNSSVYYVFHLSFIPLSQIVDLKLEKRAAYFNYNAIRLQFERGTSPRSQHVFIQMQGAFIQTFRRRCINYLLFIRERYESLFMKHNGIYSPTILQCL